MKISELIELLKEIEKDKGDLPVWVCYPETGEHWPLGKDNIEIGDHDIYGDQPIHVVLGVCINTFPYR